MNPAANLPEIIASRYRPIRLIGIGGMGAVYEVEHVRTGEHLALKVLLGGIASTPETLERFKREARVSATIKSEHVVFVTDADVAPELNGAPFLVMELLSGTDLEREAASVRPAPATVVEWMRQVAEAIDKAHALGIVHRDLKPENLFLATVGTRTMVKVVDFGIAKMIEDGTGATGSGQLLGTPKYMAPEQAMANVPITPATDRCALGLIAYRLLTGESYYQGGIMSVLGQLLHGELQAPSERASGFGHAFDTWFLKACHRHPDQRFGSASEQAEALAKALGLPAIGGNVTLPAGPTPKPTPSGTSARTGKRPPDARLPAGRGLVATGVMAALAAASIGILIGSRVEKNRAADALICGLPNSGATEACGTCMAQACCQESQECAATESCAHTESCVRACAPGDATCRFRCYGATWSDSNATLQQGVEGCRAAHCAKECLPPPWDCLDRVKWSYPSLKQNPIVLKAAAVCWCGSAGTTAPLAGTTVRICAVSDPSCRLPLATGVTDESGATTLKVDSNANSIPLAVFVEFKKAGYLDTLAHLNMPPLAGDGDLGSVPLWERQVDVAALSSTLGAKYDPTRGFVAVKVTDCGGQLATKDVVVTWLDRDAQTATMPFNAYTGSAHAINVPVNAAGITRIATRVAETNALVATTSIVVRPGAVSLANAMPAP
jgi:hypothetical protein